QRDEMRALLLPQRQRRSPRRVVWPRVDLRQPCLGDKGVQVGERREGARVEQVCDDVEEGFFDLALRLWPPRPAGPWTITIVEGKGEKARVVDRLLAVPPLDDDLHVVVETDGRRAAQMLKGPDVRARSSQNPGTPRSADTAAASS